MWFRLTAPDGNTVAVLGSAMVAMGFHYREQRAACSAENAITCQSGVGI
jgi:hypothetical protein